MRNDVELAKLFRENRATQFGKEDGPAESAPKKSKVNDQKIESKRAHPQKNASETHNERCLSNKSKPDDRKTTAIVT